MSRRRRNTNVKANNSNLAGLVATIIKEGDKYVGQKVVINNVSNLSNDIVEVFLLDDKEKNKFYLPVSDLRLFSRERSQEYLLKNITDSFMRIFSMPTIGDEDWRKHARGNAKNERIFLDPKDYQEDDSEKNYSNHVLEGGDLIIKCSEFCRNYKVSPIYFISKLSEHLYCMHERYAPKDKK